VALPIRLRLAIVSGVLTAALIGGLGSLVYLRLEGDLRAIVDEGLAERADELLAGLPETAQLPIGQSDAGDVFAQLLGADGDVLATTDELPPSSLLEDAAATSGPLVLERQIPSDEGPEWLRIQAIPVGDGRTLVVAAGFDDQRAMLGALVAELAITLPFAVVLAGLLGWFVGRAALRPVELMRSEAEAIFVSEPGRRLPVPPTRDELAALGESLNRMLERIEIAVERERRLVDDASHELRTPLANMKVEIELALRRARTPAELEAALRSAADETDRLTRLAADLLVLARARRGRVPVRLELVDLTQLVEAVVAEFGTRAKGAGISLTASVTPGLGARVDAARIRQSLENLIDNALRHTPADGGVRVAAARRDGELEISVTDSGVGFPDVFLKDAFEPFSRADEGRARSDGGVGLGLAIVRAIAEAHGGSVRAANVAPAGAVIEMRLPAVPRASV
jgi:two-component system, OmpR family, sensor kinase